IAAPFGADSLRSDNRCSLGTAPPCGAGNEGFRRLFGADSLRSDNRCSLGTAPPCGAGNEGLRRLFGADSLRSEGGRLGGGAGGRGGGRGLRREPPGSPIGPAWLAGRQCRSAPANGRLRWNSSGKVPFPLDLSAPVARADRGSPLGYGARSPMQQDVTVE